ncbi:N-acetylglucosamine-6-phosphate deacetylase [Nymphon striatum]|nr:N-acetylglucosamine-6-phosphate deacetylase [Nymphon striatum]
MPASNSALTQFYNCRLIRNNKIIKDDLWVRNGNIVNPEPIFFEEKVSPDVKIDCHGCLIAPGYIDIQINGGFGEDFSNSTVDSIGPAVDKVAKNLLKHGVTSFCPTVITSPSQVYKNLIPRIPKRKGSMNGAEVLVHTSTIMGKNADSTVVQKKLIARIILTPSTRIHIEGPFLSIEKRGAHPMNLIRAIENGFEDVQDMYGSLDNIILLTMAPEVDKTGTVIRKLVDRGIKVSVGHSTCHLQEGEVAVKNGASLITHLFNAMLPVSIRFLRYLEFRDIVLQSVDRDPGLVGLLTSDAIPEGKTVYYGIIADGIHTHPAALRIAHRTHPSAEGILTCRGLLPPLQPLLSPPLELFLDPDQLSGHVVKIVDHSDRKHVHSQGMLDVESMPDSARTTYPRRFVPPTMSSRKLVMDNMPGKFILDTEVEANKHTAINTSSVQSVRPVVQKYTRSTYNCRNKIRPIFLGRPIQTKQLSSMEGGKTEQQIVVDWQCLVLITDAISAMGLPAGTHHIGQQRIEVQGNKALIAGTDTLCGSIAVLDDCVRNFRKATGCSIVEAIECATLHPAEGLGLSNRIGTLYFDTTADFVLLDDNLNVISTYINGECVWKVEK